MYLSVVAIHQYVDYGEAGNELRRINLPVWSEFRFYKFQFDVVLNEIIFIIQFLSANRINIDICIESSAYIDDSLASTQIIVFVDLRRG